jgi:thiamine-monophosphate kinase
MQPKSSPLGEFDLIQRFFKMGADAMQSNKGGVIALGIGDDCALLNPVPGQEIAITSDMLVEGRHFFVNTDPELLGRKSLAVNLSDLAAMGAKPIGFTLAIALPTVDSAWLEAFSKGMFALANEYSCPLIGGDTTAGPLTISITAFGSIPSGKAIRRSGAKAGDDIWISGTVGDARLALAALRHEINLSDDELKQIEQRMHNPIPRVELGIKLHGIASAALDVSDGLLGDLQHILEQSEVTAEIFLDSLPKSALLKNQSALIQNQFAACGGDDYEICFTAPIGKREAIAEISKVLNLPITRIGSITAKEKANQNMRLLNQNGELLNDAQTAALLKSFDHFAK